MPKNSDYTQFWTLIFSDSASVRNVVTSYKLVTIPFSNLNDAEFQEFQFHSTFDCKCTNGIYNNIEVEILPTDMPLFNSQCANIDPNELNSSYNYCRNGMSI